VRTAAGGVGWWGRGVFIEGGEMEVLVGLQVLGVVSSQPTHPPIQPKSCHLCLPQTTQQNSVSMEGLFPCGEGAGYAGGIVSAAVDGMRVGEAVVETITGVNLGLGF